MKVEIIRLKKEKLLRYKVWVKEGDLVLARDWTFTLRGARRRAKQMIHDIKNPKDEAEIIEEYEVQ